MKILLLWDIDGTLILSGGAGMRAMQRALKSVFHIDRPIIDVDFAGRTDGYIMRGIFRQLELSATEENFSRFFEGYLAALPDECANPHARVLPGVPALLRAAAAHGEIAQGLLTGNRRRSAQVKLAHHGLWEHFAFGAFGDDAELRNELGPHARRRAREHHGVDFAVDRTWVIGDTPFDIECGEAIGVRTLAVATGAFTLEQLQAKTPTALLADLTDTAGVLKLFET